MQISDLTAATAAALEAMGYTSLSAIQDACIPPALENRDIYAVVPTGTGKTAAFLIPVIERLIPQGSGRHRPQALILCPTRELAAQTAAVSRRLLSSREGFRTALLCGGTDMNSQVRSFRTGADIVVGTPSRILDHLRRHTLKKEMLSVMVLDEADEMLSMGFSDDVLKIFGEIVPAQVMMFSATESEAARDLAGKMLRDPFEVNCGKDDAMPHRLRLFHLMTSPKEKQNALTAVLKDLPSGQVLIFCATRDRCDALCALLKEKGYSCETIHSEMDPARRRHIMRAFRDGSIRVLVATDVAARGIDHAGIDTVIQYDCADSEEILVHRMGRTGRNSRTGTVITLLTPSEKEKAAMLRKAAGMPSLPYGNSAVPGKKKYPQNKKTRSKGKTGKR